uniref:ZT_dimer domain-containing protein n=1 Tax=Steinernema glaseri TaxID=37863 RepID=A0A1I8AS09_9BILA
MVERSEKQPLLEKTRKSSIRSEQKASDRVGFFQRRRRAKSLSRYYAEQDELLQLYKADDDLLQGFDKQMHSEKSMHDKAQAHKVDSILSSLTFILNVCLLFGNLTAAILSQSLSVVSAFIDSAMDITSGGLIFLSLRAISNTNRYFYPRGRHRLELVAVVISSIIMGVANIMMIIQSAESIINKTVHPDANLPTVIILLGGCSLKIVLLIICLKRGTTSSKTLALDQRNDIITSLVALSGAYIGDHYWLYADPLGAILVCSFIAFSWFYNAMDHIPMMVGRRAEQQQISRILRIAIEHDERIICLDHIMVYHTGAQAIVELHIVLDEHLPLRVTHDITEALEDKIRALDFVERIFVHVDYRCDGDAEI